jgi:precorrin-4 C11-methyltransferase
MKVAVILISNAGLSLALRIKQTFDGASVYGKEPSKDVIAVDSFTDTVKNLFSHTDAFIFIGALGICVRTIAPCLKDKHIDPAVVCIDSTGQFVIPVVSGHIGGSNDLSRQLALLTGGEAVITTQSDNEGLWALDTLGQKYNWHTGDNWVTNEIIALFVKRRPTALLLDIRDAGTNYLERTCPDHVTLFYSFDDILLNQFELLITVGPYIYNVYIPLLSFFPPVLHIGFGCRKEMPGDSDTLFETIRDTLAEYYLSIQSIKDFATIDLKKEEPILCGMADTYHYPIVAYLAEELDCMEVPNPSGRVREAVRSASVAEAAALKAAKGGTLLVEKQKKSIGAGSEFTLAVAIDSDFCRKGYIEIVGAGPGDPGLISVRGKELLEQADLILYAGSLVPRELTFYAKKGATVQSSATMHLEEQFILMKEFYDKKKRIVRLHTGDPCIYGAIQEQMAFFDRHHMSYHITPGISSFQAAAAALRSQFTIPEKVQTIILTRGEGRTPMPEREQLHKLAASQSTMCIFLSAELVEQVQNELLVHYPPATPVAACYRLTWKDERTYRGELKDLAYIVKKNNLTLTTLLVIGEAIGNREGLSRLYADEFKHLFRP